MWESVWPNIASDFVTALLAGSASLTIQWMAPRVLHALTRLRFVARSRATEKAARPRVERRLAAVLAVDVAGYSRLMDRDEEGTHQRLTALRHQVMEPKLRGYRGRIVKNTGDGALVEFTSVVDAVEYAMELQGVMAVQNAGVRQDHRIALRMGVSVGEVIVESNDIYGDIVKVAARLEGLATPGGICISADAWRCARGRVAAEAVDLGQHRLKNIAEPAHVYAIAGPMEMMRVTSPTHVPEN